MNRNRTRAIALSDHINALGKYVRGSGPLPEPSRELAADIMRGYWTLLDEHQRTRHETGGALAYERLHNLLAQCPALEKWRVLVLDAPRRSPLEKAAAYELLGVLFDLDCETVNGEIARQFAAEAIAAANPTRREVAA